MNRTFNRVAVLMGGPSSEREISLQTGHAVTEGLRQAGYEVESIIVSETAAFSLPQGTEAVFVALHGTFGEDGGVQNMLEQMGIPYTGSRPLSSEISFDKVRSRAAFLAAGVPVPPGYILSSGQSPGEPKLDLPLVVKPPRQGSSVGITCVKRAEDYTAAIKCARQYSEDVLVESYIPGREWTVPIVSGIVLPIIEITTQADDGWYDWNAKYRSGGTTRYTFPEDDPANAIIAKTVRRAAMQAFEAVDAWSLGRVDFRISPEGHPFVLELNAIPGCTESSLLPKSAAKARISFPTLCTKIMEDAKCG